MMNKIQEYSVMMSNKNQERERERWRERNELRITGKKNYKALSASSSSSLCDFG